MLFQGMAYLHSMGVIHRDLKSSNIILDADGRVKIVDFGLSCFQSSGPDHTAETGTYRWMAPEVICHEPYSTAADVYSFGVVLWELLTRDRPFKDMTPIQAAFAVARHGHRPPIPQGTPPPLASLIRRCWHSDPAARPTFEQVVALLRQMRPVSGP
jgi:serine/threonine protein kinase